MRLQLVRWDAARREGLFERLVAGFDQTMGDWKWSEREADETQLEGEGALFQTERRLRRDVMIAIQ